MGIPNPHEFVGTVTGRSVLTMERGPASAFARALGYDDPVFFDEDAAEAAGLDGIAVPPTFPVAAGYWGRFPEDQPADDPAAEGSVLVRIMTDLIAQRGGIMLHGEQEFRYHRPLVVGERLHHLGRIVDVYEKDSKGTTMTFVVQEDEYRDADGEPVVTARLNLLHRA